MLRLNPETFIGEKLLLETYGISLPARLSEIGGCQDDVAKGVLQLYHPALLAEHIPLKIGADGNCFYRSLSQALFGHEEYHLLIRLLSSIEIMENRNYYDTKSRDYIDLINDDRVIHYNYNVLCRSVTTPGKYADMLTFFAASSALGIKIQSYYPPQSFMTSGPYTRTIVGRGVRAGNPDLTVMWTTMKVPKSGGSFRPNHIVVLKRIRNYKEEDAIIISGDEDPVKTSNREDDQLTLDELSSLEVSIDPAYLSENENPSLPSSPKVELLSVRCSELLVALEDDKKELDEFHSLDVPFDPANLSEEEWPSLSLGRKVNHVSV